MGIYDTIRQAQGWGAFVPEVEEVATAKPGVFGRMAAQFPTIKKGLGAVPVALSRAKSLIPAWATSPGAGTAGGAVLTALPEAFGVAETIADPTKSVADVGTRAGEGMFRTGMTGIGVGLGAAAGGGIASIPLAAAGGYGANKLADWILSLRGNQTVAAPNVASMAVAPDGYTRLPASGVVPIQPGEEEMGAANLGATASTDAGVATSGARTRRVITTVTPEDTYENKAPPGSLASFFGAAMHQKQVAAGEATARLGAEAQANRDVELSKITRAGAIGPKEQMEAVALAQRIVLAAQVADPKEKAAILAGHNPPEPRKLEFPIGLQPMPGSGDNTAVAADPNSPGRVFKIPIQSQVAIAKGSDGKTYILGPDGKALREATAAEIKNAKPR